MPMKYIFYHLIIIRWRENIRKVLLIICIIPVEICFHLGWSPIKQIILHARLHWRHAGFLWISIFKKNGYYNCTWRYFLSATLAEKPVKEKNEQNKGIFENRNRKNPWKAMSQQWQQWNKQCLTYQWSPNLRVPHNVQNDEKSRTSLQDMQKRIATENKLVEVYEWVNEYVNEIGKRHPNCLRRMKTKLIIDGTCQILHLQWIRQNLLF